MPSGSEMIALTSATWLAAGTAGSWIGEAKVGPELASRVELGAPGVPPPCGSSMARMSVRGRRLKYSRELSWFEPDNQRARKLNR